MRKPSNLKLYVDNKIKEYSKAYLESDNEQDKAVLNALLKMLFDIQAICETRKKY